MGNAPSDARWPAWAPGSSVWVRSVDFFDRSGLPPKRRTLRWDIFGLRERMPGTGGQAGRVASPASPNKMPRYALAVARPMGRRSALRRYQPYTWWIAPVRISTHLCGRLTDLFVSMSVYSKLDIEEDIHTTKLILLKGRVNLEPVAKKLTAP